ISVLQDFKAFSCGFLELMTGFVLLALLGELNATCRLTEGFEAANFCGIGRPASGESHHVSPAGVAGISQGEAHELLGQGKVELGCGGKKPPLPDGWLRFQKRMRLQQTASGIEVAAKHLQPKKIVVCAGLQCRLQRSPQLQPVELGKGQAEFSGSFDILFAEAEQCGTKLQQVVEKEAVLGNPV